MMRFTSALLCLYSAKMCGVGADGCAAVGDCSGVLRVRDESFACYLLPGHGRVESRREEGEGLVLSDSALRWQSQSSVWVDCLQAWLFFFGGKELLLIWSIDSATYIAGGGYRWRRVDYDPVSHKKWPDLIIDCPWSMCSRSLFPLSPYSPFTPSARFSATLPFPFPFPFAGPMVRDLLSG